MCFLLLCIILITYIPIPYEEYIRKISDWLNAHHLDYRGLIEKGLALEAPEGIYKTE